MHCFEHDCNKLIERFLASLSDEQKRWFLDYFKKLCKFGVKETERSNREVDFDSSPSKVPGVSRNRNKSVCVLKAVC